MDKECSIQGCGPTPKLVHGLCDKHYKRLYRHGDPLSVQRGKDKTPAQHFWSRVAITANPDRCWEWTGSKGAVGYGTIRFQKKYMSTHVLAWTLANNQKPERLILHSCDNRLCCNPKHLREGTSQDNSSDAVIRGRTARGSMLKQSKLDPEKVRIIRNLYKKTILSQAQIAKQFRVVQQTIWQVLANKSWRWVD